MFSHIWLLAYVASVVLVNIGFSIIPPVMTPLGLFAPMAILVGGIFILRDYAQRESGHKVLFAMAVGAILSYFLASPYVALASAAAFAVSELVDWLVYTYAKNKPFRERVLLSSAISTPIDTTIFLLGISAFSVGTFLIMVMSKMLAVAIVWYLHKPADPIEMHFYTRG